MENTNKNHTPWVPTREDQIRLQALNLAVNSVKEPKNVNPDEIVSVAKTYYEYLICCKSKGTTTSTPIKKGKSVLSALFWR